MSTTTGANTIWVYRWEDTDAYNQAPGDPSDTTDKTFGADVTADAADRNNNPERMFSPFAREAETVLELQFDGSWGADFILTNTWWLQFVFGEPITSGTSAPYTHDYSISNDNPPRTAHLIEETHYPNGDTTQTVYTGCFTPSIDVDVSVEDTVEISIDGVYADEEFYSTASNSPYGAIGSQPSIDYRPMHFGNSQLDLDVDDDGSAETRALVQDASLSMEANAEGEYELGTRFIALPSNLQFEPDLSYTNLVDDTIQAEEQQAAYGDTAVSAPQETMNDATDLKGNLIFDANTGTDNKLDLALTGAFPDTYSRNNIGDPNEALEDDIDRIVRKVEPTVDSDQQDPD